VTGSGDELQGFPPVVELRPEGVRTNHNAFSYGVLDDDGDYVIEGLPPEVEVILQPWEAHLVTGAPGSVFEFVPPGD
jgi:hypothetical protein